MRVDVHIERLVLDESLLGGERPVQVGAALERALRRMLGGPGGTVALRRIGRVNAIPPLSLPDGSRTPRELGARIASAVGRGIGIGAQELLAANASDRIEGGQR